MPCPPRAVSPRELPFWKWPPGLRRQNTANRPHGLIRHVTRQVNRCRPRDSSRDAGSPPPLPAPRQTLAPRPSAHTRCPDATPVAASAARRPPRVPPPDAAATPRSTALQELQPPLAVPLVRAATRRSQPRLVTWYKPSSMSVLKGRAMEFKSYCVHYRASRPGAMWRAMSIRIAPRPGTIFHAYYTNS